MAEQDLNLHLVLSVGLLYPFELPARYGVQPVTG